nr:MAG TPA: hypothetical protein [Caudoviricetes sp.]
MKVQDAFIKNLKDYGLHNAMLWHANYLNNHNLSEKEFLETFSLESFNFFNGNKFKVVHKTENFGDVVCDVEDGYIVIGHLEHNHNLSKEFLDDIYENDDSELVRSAIVKNLSNRL